MTSIAEKNKTNRGTKFRSKRCECSDAPIFPDFELFPIQRDILDILNAEAKR